MAVSLTVVISGVIVTAALIAAIVAFTPTYIAGVESVADTITDLRNNIIIKARIGVEQFMLAPVNGIEALATREKHGLINMGTASNEAKIRTTCDFNNKIDGVSNGAWIEPFVPNTDIYNTQCDGRQVSPPIVLQNSSDLFYMFQQDLETGIQDWNKPYATVRGTSVAIPKMYSWGNHTPQYALKAGNGSAMWLPATYGFNSVEYRVGFSFKDRYGGDGAFFVRVLPVTLSAFLDTLNLRPRARALIVDTKGAQFVLGVSWNETTEELFEGYQNTRLPGPERMLLKTVSDFKDGLVNDVISHFGGAEGFFAQPSPLATEMGSGKERVYINIENVTDKFGLDMRVLLAMPELDFMEDTYKSRDMTIGIVVACLVVMVVVAILFSIAITKPLDRIGYRMYKTAALQDEDGDDSPSILSEVRSMQEAYTTMKRELNRMKSYLPQSVLCGDDDDEDDEDASATASRISDSDGGSQKSKKTRVSDTMSVVSSLIGAPVVAALNTNTGVIQKRVVVTVFNLIGFLEISAASSGTVVAQKLQSQFLTIVNKISRDSKGVVDSFQGDHIIVTFNAVNNVACPAKRAAVVALLVCQEAKKNPDLPRVSVGLSYGSAIVGNTGSTDMQRFNIIGPVFQRALALERLAAQHLKKNLDDHYYILGSQSTNAEVSLEFYCQAVDLVQLPATKADLAERVISIVQIKSVGSDEWMYQLEEGEKGDPFTAVNAIFEALSTGDVAAAKQLLEERGTVAADSKDAAAIGRASELANGAKPTIVQLR